MFFGTMFWTIVFRNNIATISVLYQCWFTWDIGNIKGSKHSQTNKQAAVCYLQARVAVFCFINTSKMTLISWDGNNPNSSFSHAKFQIFRIVSIVGRMKAFNSEQRCHRVGYMKGNCSFPLKKSLEITPKFSKKNQTLAKVRQFSKHFMNLPN